MNPNEMQQMLGQARQMQEQMQQKMAGTVVEATSGGGVVTVKMNGQKQILKLRIDPNAIAGLGANSADIEMLEDLITAAVNEAGRRADEALQSGISGLLGGLNLPGLF